MNGLANDLFSCGLFTKSVDLFLIKWVMILLYLHFDIMAWIYYRLGKRKSLTTKLSSVIFVNSCAVILASW